MSFSSTAPFMMRYRLCRDSVSSRVLALLHHALAQPQVPW